MDNENKLSRRRFIQLVSSVGVGTVTGCTHSHLQGSPDQEVSLVSDSKMAFPLRLHSNENPYGPFPKALTAIQDIAKKSNLYSRDTKVALRNALAKHFRLDGQQVLLGCGSIELLKIVAEVFCSPTQPPVIPEPVYEAINYYASLHQTDPVKVPLTNDFKHDLDRMAEIGRKNESMIYICNPANPTGTILGKNTIRAFLDKVPKHVIVVVDEAYAEYTDRSDFESCVRYVQNDRSNVLVLRTFSKLYGLAGLRVGYALGPKHLIRAMSAHRLWNNINQAGAAAALASLADKQSMSIVRRQNARVKQDFYEQARDMGLQYIPSETNFVMVNVNRPAPEMIAAFKERRVLVGRLIPSLPEYLRITLGTREEISYFFDVLKEIKSKEI